MGLKNDVLVSVSLLAIGLGTVGCAGLDTVERKMNQAAARLESKPDYEGRLVSSKRVGAMTALQFEDGKYIDVRHAPSTLVAGDIIRLYKKDQGYEAHLWRAVNPQQGS